MKKLFTILAVAAASFTANAQLSLAVGATAPNWTVTDIHGGTHTLYELTASGKTVLIDFFFRNCGPCQTIAPYVTQFYNKYGCNNGNVYIISMSSQDNNATVQEFENLYSGTNPGPAASFVEGGTSPVVNGYGPAAYPTVCIIGTDNKIKNNDVWPINSIAEIENAVTATGVTLTPMTCTNGIAENNNLVAFEMYPNPAAAVVNVSYELNATSDVIVEMYNIVGEQVQINKFIGISGVNRSEIDVTSLANGQYIVKVIANGEEVKTSKLNVVR